MTAHFDAAARPVPELFRVQDEARHLLAARKSVVAGKQSRSCAPESVYSAALLNQYSHSVHIAAPFDCHTVISEAIQHSVPLW